MNRIPILVEVTKHPEAQLCRAISEALLQHQVAPVGMATSLEELHEILETLKKNGLQPAIFVINTFESRDILKQLDPLMGESPAIYLRRQLYAGQSGLMEQDPNNPTVKVLKSMIPRLTSIWMYGAKSAASVTQSVVKCTLKFHADGDFRHFEVASKHDTD